RGKPTLVVAIADRDAGDGEQGWWDAADRTVPGVQKLSIISLSLPFFVGDSYARNKAKERIPKQYWSVNLMDTDGKMAKELGLPDDKLPTVFALDPEGRVAAAFHGKVSDPGADAIWRALQGSKAAEAKPAPGPG